MFNRKLKQRLAELNIIHEQHRQIFATLRQANDELLQANKLLIEEITWLKERYEAVPYKCKCGEVIFNLKEKRGHKCQVR